MQIVSVSVAAKENDGGVHAAMQTHAAMKKVNIPYETIVSISMWDLPGREEMDLRKSYYTDVDAAIGTPITVLNLSTNC